MKKEEKLKKQLIEIKKNGELPRNINYYDLSLEMISCIGTIDYELRDNLIFSILAKIIGENKLSCEEMKKILHLLLSEEHLFKGLGNIESDSVFNRTFSILIVDEIVNVNNKLEENFLKKTEIIEVFHKVIKYAEEEKDYRGYVREKGWAHSTAHLSDVLCSLAQSEAMGIKELKCILEIIYKKVCIDTYNYINEEDDRLVNTFMCIYDRGIIKIDEFILWINKFNNLSFQGEVEKQEALRENVKLFLRSLYFRCKRRKLEEDIVAAVEEVLDNIPAFY